MQISILKERDYTFKAYGLKPYTQYYLYVNKVQNSTRAKQFGKKLGDPLVTDKNGQIQVVFYIDSFIPSTSPKSDKAKINTLKSGPLEIILSVLEFETLPENYSESSVSTAKTTISG